MKCVKIIVICLILILAIAAAVCLLPRSGHSDHTFHGAMVTADGTVLEECDITLKTTKLHYLLKEDAYESIDLQVADYHFDTVSYTSTIPFWGEPTYDYEKITFIAYNADTNSFSDQIDIGLSFDGDWCFVKLSIGTKDEAIYFVGSADENINIPQILDTCSM